MNKIIFYIFLVLSTFCFAQNDAVNYYPLKQGNIWVYQFGSSYGVFYRYKISITNTNITNGHIYYYLDNKYIRVDSVNGNLYQLFSGSGCPYSINERMIDSLSSRLNDSARRNCGTDVNRCIDTNIRIKMGISMRTKHFIYMNAGNAGNVYARGFGIISGYGGSNPNLWGIELLGCVLNGTVYGDTSLLTGLSQIGTEIPSSLHLSQNYPNPFNPVTKIKFQIPLLRGVPEGRGVLIQLTVFDAIGKEAAILVDQQLQPGTYEADWDASAFPSGVYYYKLETGSFSETKKMVLIR